jgi:hypothetical protein
MSHVRRRRDGRCLVALHPLLGAGATVHRVGPAGLLYCPSGLIEAGIPLVEDVIRSADPAPVSSPRSLALQPSGSGVPGYGCSAR